MRTTEKHVLYALVIGFCAGAVLGACPSLYQEIGGGCFLVIGSPFDFLSAREVCLSYNGDLAVVNDCSLLGSLSEYLQASFAENSVWVGASDLASEGQWEWIDGTPVEMGAPFWARITPENYSPEPDGGTNENCAAMGAGAGYYFQDIDCESYSRYAPLCEIAPDPSTSSCPGQYQAVGDGRCFLFLSTVDATWQDARVICGTSGGDLAIIDDCHVMNSVIDFAEQTGSVPANGFWIGGTDAASEGNWMWIDGSSMAMGAPFWGRIDSGGLEPDDAQEDENCLILWSSDRYLFNDNPCTSDFFPLCQTSPIAEE